VAKRISQANSPGRSARTPGKHAALAKLAGRQFGIFQVPAARVKMRVNPRQVKVFDLCAGDGVYDEEQEKFWADTSPGIFAYHAQYRSAESDALPVDVHLYETSENSYRLLRGQMKRELAVMHELRTLRGQDRRAAPYEVTGVNTWRAGNVTVTLHHGSGVEASLAEVNAYTAVVLSNDPNSMGGDWPLKPEFLQELRNQTSLSTMVSTMGCNPGGLMRLPLEQRRGWYDRVTAIDGAVWGSHDTLLARIERDDQKWAYAFTVPTAFRDVTETDTRTAFSKNGGYQLQTAWMRLDPEGARQMQDQLFLRSGE
jgi:hypothetical protein